MQLAEGRRVTAAVLALAVLMLACGDDSDDQGVVGTSQPVTSPTETSDTTTTLAPNVTAVRPATTAAPPHVGETLDSPSPPICDHVVEVADGDEWVQAFPGSGNEVCDVTGEDPDGPVIIVPDNISMVLQVRISDGWQLGAESGVGKKRVIDVAPPIWTFEVEPVSGCVQFNLEAKKGTDTGYWYWRLASSPDVCVNNDVANQ